MILFVADDHYKKRPGFHLHEAIKGDYEIEFHENDWSAFDREGLKDKYDLIILNMIADTCGLEKPSATAEKNIKAYLEAGGSMLLCHGSSAAFWHYDWWRPLVGFRWVRGGDPDGSAPSTHPVRPFEVVPSKCTHPLVKKLKPLDLPTDEIYINLEQTCPAWTLMETSTDEGVFPQVYATQTPWGGTLLTSLPGHAKDVTSSPVMVEHSKTLIDHLLASSSR